MYYLLSLAFGLTLYSCQPNPPAAAEQDLPQMSPEDSIVGRAIAHHYGDYYADANVSFVFREKQYTIRQQGGVFAYARTWSDTTDLVTNDGILRLVGDREMALTEKQKAAYTEAVNSVRYFFMLPYGLNDPAVQKEYLGQQDIKEKLYDVLRVTFAAEGGGVDHDDVYYYYFHAEEGKLDYLAYSFTVNGGGVRFRAATNERRVGGKLVQDYINYKPEAADTPVGELAEHYAADKLVELSRIENTNIRMD